MFKVLPATMINVIFLASISSYYIYDHFGENLIFSPTPEFIFLVSIKIMYFEALGKAP